MIDCVCVAGRSRRGGPGVVYMGCHSAIHQAKEYREVWVWGQDEESRLGHVYLEEPVEMPRKRMDRRG